MTPKIAAYLADRSPATPCLVLDVDRVEQNYRTLLSALPLARVYYAVKANPGRSDPGASRRPRQQFRRCFVRGGRVLPECRRGARGH